MAAIQRFQKQGKIWNVIFTLFAAAGILLAINQLFNLSLFGITLLETSYFYLILAVYLSSVFILFPAGKTAPRDRVPWYDALLFIVTFVTGIYFGLHGMDIIQLGWEFDAPTLPTLFSVLMWLLVMEAVRRSTDIYMLITCLVLSLFPLFAIYMPGFMQGQSYDFLTTARLYTMGRNGIIGIPIDVVCSLLIGFMVFGIVLQGTGGGNFFFQLAQSLLGHTRGGAAKISILASGFFGMISGSTTSNTLTIGAMTIPAMKNTGFPAHYAAAIEACASTGGPIMPPVMGAGAFIMAYFLNVPYSYVAIGALIPACLYYLGLFVQVDGYAAKNNLQGLPKSELPSFWKTLKDGWFYILDILLLIYLLLYMNWEGKAPYYASGVLVLLAMIRKDTRLNWKTFLELIGDIGRVTAQLVGILAGAGLIIGGLSVTGVALAFSSELVGAVGDNTFLILLTGAFSSFVLGLGMTITACYVFLAIVMAPALITLGIDPLAAHLFVFYWGVLSEITPPVALCVSAAAGLAGSNFMQTGWTAMRLGAIKYIVPFFFAYNPALLTHGTWSEVLLAVSFAVIGVFYLGSALERYIWGVGKINLTSSALFILGGLLTAFPEIISSLIGVAILLVVHGVNYLNLRKIRMQPSGG
jgi:TRAP transporter 4TM/12TM fusion protein